MTNDSRGAVSKAVSEMGFHHGSLEGATYGGCKCETCVESLKSYCSPNGIPACHRLPDHAGKCSLLDKDRTLDMLEQEFWSMNFSRMHREYIRSVVRSHQS